MSRAFTRGLRTTSRAFIQFTGKVSLNDILTSNGSTGRAWETAVKRVCDAIEKADPRISKAYIQGAKAHRSSKDTSDHQLVLTVDLKTASDTRIGTIHVHVDGTCNFFCPRAERRRGYKNNIFRACIEGYIENSESESRNSL